MEKNKFISLILSLLISFFIGTSLITAFDYNKDKYNIESEELNQSISELKDLCIPDIIENRTDKIIITYLKFMDKVFLLDNLKN